MYEEKRITLRLPGDLHARIAAQAERDRRSLNSQILYLLESAVADAVPGSDGTV